MGHPHADEPQISLSIIILGEITYELKNQGSKCMILYRA
jgi:hypothetical protein